MTTVPMLHDDDRPGDPAKTRGGPRRAARLIGALASAPALLTAAARRLRAARLASPWRGRRWRDVAFDALGQGVACFDGAGRLTFCNRRFLALHRLRDDEARVGMRLEEIVAARELRDAFAPPIETAFARRAPALARGEVFEATLGVGDRTAAAARRLASGGWAAAHEDVAALERFRARAAYLARMDPLTQSPNRAAAIELIGERLAASPANRRRVALLLIDVDRFKLINAAHGHRTGDALLREAARRLRENCRARDCVARYSDDEFIVVAEFERGDEGAAALAERLSACFAAPLRCGPLSLPVSVSVGVAVADRSLVDVDVLLSRADFALSRAKAAGPGRRRFFDARMERFLNERTALRQELALALERGELELFYQPFVGVADLRVRGFEALLRWRHPRRGLVSPGDFVSIAEESGLIGPIGDWVIATACREAAPWPGDLRVAVNVSPTEFVLADVPCAVRRALARSRLAANRLEIEITEDAVMEERGAAALAQLRRMGVALSLDDFGTGYASFGRLRRFRFDRIKIDRGWIAELTDSVSPAFSLVRAIARCAADLGVAATAEGVETREQLERVAALGVGEAQGYYFSRPVPAGEVSRLIARDRPPLAAAG